MRAVYFGVALGGMMGLAFAGTMTLLYFILGQRPDLPGTVPWNALLFITLWGLSMASRPIMGSLRRSALRKVQSPPT